MTGALVDAAEAGIVTEAAVQMQEAVTEESIFAVLHAACAVFAGPIGLDGYVVALTGRTARRVAAIGTPIPLLAPTEVEAWLLGDDVLDRATTLSVPGAVVERLIGGGRLVGAMVVSGAGLDARTLAHLHLLAQLAGTALAGLYQRRLSNLVLEALEQSEEAISFYDETEGVVFTNDAYHRVFPHYPDRGRLLGRSHLDLYRMDLAAGVIDDPLARSDPEAYLADRARRSCKLVDRQREIQRIGDRTYIYTRSRSKTGATMSRRIDITEHAATEARLRERERELHALAFQDPLTGLFNRAYLRERLHDLHNDLENDSGTTPRSVAVFLVDLDGFKVINDTYGHDCGDHVLRTVADRLSRGVPEADVLVRLGGDEFVLLFDHAGDEVRLDGLARRIVDLIGEPVVLGELAIRAGASIGIACSEPGGDLASILGDADLAMVEAKRQKAGAHVFYHPDLRGALLKRLGMVEDLRGALRRGEFEVHYQPQYTTGSGRLVGFEALARWHHPTHGMVSPAEFIPIMEEYGLIEALGAWVLEAACTEARSWPADLHVAVNVSPLQMRSPHFALTVCETLMRTGLPPHRLELEITESVFLSDADATRAQLDQWKALGIRIALDDFGCGYSNLGYLNAFPIDKLKIDRAFLGSLDPSDPDAGASVVLRAIVDLGRALGLTVTAEGVERADQLEFLARVACAQVQGFLLGRPMPADAVAVLLRGIAAANTAA